ncbi:MAG TPA: YCF48-related protein [Ignavibacteriaceae bacterium]|nr:YCF48-related protein [Ignavibacteriaceae bacterium]
MILDILSKTYFNCSYCKIVIILLFLLLLTYQDLFAQQDSTILTQYRRGIELQSGYQSYEQKYAGKNLNEEKRNSFPLESTGIWTELHPRIPRVTYFGVQFINPDTGWAVGNLGALIKTINGGEDWTISETNTTTLLLKVHSFNGQIVVATGYDGIILRSIDGGETFTQVVSGVGSGIDLWGVQMLNDTLGFVCGLNQTLLKTTDAGLTWQPVNTGLNAYYWALDFIDESNGMIACGGGKVLKTTDGGNTWTVHQAGDASDLYAIDIIDSLHIITAGANGKNVYSSDGGVTWIQNNRLQHDELNSIKFIDTNTGYTIGIYQAESWGIRKTTNRGATWFAPPSPNLSEWELELLPGGIGYSVGSNLWIAKTTNGYDNWEGLFLNANFVDVFFTGELTGYAADGRYTGGPLYKTTDGGLTWFGLPNFPSQVFTSSLRSIYFTDSLTGFAGSAPARIIKTTDAGESWYIVNRTGLTDTIGLINRFFFINPTTGWAVTTRGGILKTTDAGENWFAQLNAGISVIFSGVYFVDSLYGWTAGGRPYKTTDGGNNWIQQINTNIWLSDDVYFYNYLKGWIIVGNKLYYTVDGGNEWIQDPQIYTYSRNFETISNNHFIITGTNIYESVDTGQVWQNITEQVGSYFTALHAPKIYLAYGVGPLGYIIRYIDTSLIPVELINFSAEQIENKILLKWITATETNNSGFQIERQEAKKSRIEDWKNIGFVNGNGTTTEPRLYSFVDENLSAGKYQYRLKQTDFDGSFEYSNTIEVEISIPTRFSLNQNFPNPFNPSTIIKYSLKDDGRVSLKIFNSLGEEVRTLVNEIKPAGNYEVEFNASELPSGIYIYSIQAGEFISSKKMILLK